MGVQEATESEAGEHIAGASTGTSKDPLDSPQRHEGAGVEGVRCLEENIIRVNSGGNQNISPDNAMELLKLQSDNY